ncbi:MAG: S1 RNA-binding domain-containing protein [Oscillospiraceae bacterium]|nr:S1 RNA-binding domain-containing protein [Oscillospiraceae bacterium]
MEFKIGDLIKGRVIKLIKIGVFVDIGGGKTGFVHISELSNKYIKMPSDVVKVGDIIEVKIIKIEDEKIGLSIKQVLNKKDPESRNIDQQENKNKINKINKSSQKQFKNKEEQFEDMMKKFKTTSEQKLSDLKKHLNNKQRRSKNK